jgi:hypothetical protein
MQKMDMVPTFLLHNGCNDHYDTEFKLIRESLPIAPSNTDLFSGAVAGSCVSSPNSIVLRVALKDLCNDNPVEVDSMAIPISQTR